MFFLKRKQSSDEFLPPPSPFPIFEHEEEQNENSDISNPVILNEKPLPEIKKDSLPEIKEIGDLIGESNQALDLKKRTVKKIKLKSKNIKIFKKSGYKNLDADENFLADDINADFKNDLKLDKQDAQIKPQEIIEAEEEIKSAIEKIKEREKTSLFKKFFPTKPKAQESIVEEHLAPESPEVYGIGMVQENIKEARLSLAKFDLESAKKYYLEIMKMYNKMEPEEKSKVYKDVNNLYFERKSAEELKM